MTSDSAVSDKIVAANSRIATSRQMSATCGSLMELAVSGERFIT